MHLFPRIIYNISGCNRRYRKSFFYILEFTMLWLLSLLEHLVFAAVVTAFITIYQKYGFTAVTKNLIKVRLSCRKRPHNSDSQKQCMILWKISLLKCFLQFWNFWFFNFSAYGYCLVWMVFFILFLVERSKSSPER